MRGVLFVVVSASACGRSNQPPTPAPEPSWSVRCAAVEAHPAADTHPTFELGVGRVRGDLPAEQVRNALERAGAQFARCDADQRAGTPQLAGSVEASFFINPDGSVTSSTTSVVPGTAGAMQSLATCVEQVIMQLQFPRPRGGGGVLATYPIVVHPPRMRTLAAEVRDVADAVQRALAARLVSISTCLEQAHAAVAVAPTGLASVVFDAVDRAKCGFSDLAIAHTPTEHTAVSCTFGVSR